MEDAAGGAILAPIRRVCNGRGGQAEKETVLQGRWTFCSIDPFHAWVIWGLHRGSTTTSPLCPLPIAHRRSEGVSLFCLGHFSTRKTRMGGTNVRQVRPPIHAITAFGCLVRSAEGESGVADCCGSPEGSPLAGILRMQDITGYIFVRKDGDCATGFRAAVVRQLAYLAWSWKWV